MEQSLKSAEGDTPLDSENRPNLMQLFLDYVLLLAKHKKLIFFSWFSVVLLSIIYAFSLPNIYTAKTMFVSVEEDKSLTMGSALSQMGGIAGLAGGALGGSAKAELYSTILKSDSIKDPIIDRFNLLTLYKAKYRYLVYKRMEGLTQITIGKKDGVISLSFDDKDPQRAADIANAYVEELGKLAASLRMRNAAKQRSFLASRLVDARTDMVKAEDALKGFQSENKALDVSQQTKASIESIAQFYAQLASMEVRLANLRRQFADSSQEVKANKTAIENLKHQIAKLEGSGGNGSIPTVGAVPELGQKYVRLMREFKIQDAVLEMLTRQFEIASLNEAQDVPPIQVIQIARVPEIRSKPVRRDIVMKNGIAVFFFYCYMSLLRKECFD
jgi:tyrosine-protein kinase Etk/Wzc